VRGVSDVRRLWIPGPGGKIEAALRIAETPRGCAVIAHPHPLHGGTLHNPVVFHADRELHRDGWTTLRFNFRGVGESEGTHDDGVGEVEDLDAAVHWLRGIAAGLPQIVVGYSFGSWCAIKQALRDPAVLGLVAIGLPLRLRPVEGLEELGRPITVVQGDDDEFGSPDDVRIRLARLEPPGKLEIVAGAGHLFPGRAREAGLCVARAAADLLSADAD